MSDRLNFTDQDLEDIGKDPSQLRLMLEAYEESVADTMRAKQELEFARRIQLSFCPKCDKYEGKDVEEGSYYTNEVDDDFEIAASMCPAESVGGDYFDVAVDEEKMPWFVIGDVSGHGLVASLIMMITGAAFNTMMSTGKRAKYPAAAYKIINDALIRITKNRMGLKQFMTMVILKYVGNGQFIYAGAHCDIIVYRKKTGKCELLKTNGIWLGIKENISDFVHDSAFHTDIGDIVVVYTDGITESRHRDNRERLMGMDILQDIIIQNADNGPKEIEQKIKDAAMEWCGDKPDDDITSMVLKRKK